MRGVRLLQTVFVLACFAILAFGCASAAAQVPPAKPPNIVFVLTDDQEASLLADMPYTNELLVEKGTTFERAFVSLPSCCPSRATMLRGQYAHNHGIWTNRYPEGGARLFAQEGLDSSTVATWLDGSGYRTTLVGKYLNEYETLDVPPGWDGWFGQLGQPNDADFNANGRRVVYEGRHSDAVIKKRAVSFVKKAAPQGEPFFLWVGFNAPHAPGNHEAAYDAEFMRRKLPKPASFNEADVSDKPAWVRDEPRLSTTDVREMTALYRNRLRSLQTVDAAVRQIAAALQESGELTNTYIVFTSDNGLHTGEHRFQPAKGTPYLEDVHVPLVVRGPAATPGQKKSELVLNIDLAPTLAALAGIPAPDFVDGRSLAPLLNGTDGLWRDAVLIEGRSGVHGAPPFSGILTRDRSYVEYATGEKELYDLSADPYQLSNLEGQRPKEEAALKARLEALKGCAAKTCRTAEGGAAP